MVSRGKDDLETGLESNVMSVGIKQGGYSMADERWYDKDIKELVEDLNAEYHTTNKEWIKGITRLIEEILDAEFRAALA